MKGIGKSVGIVTAFLIGSGSFGVDSISLGRAVFGQGAIISANGPIHRSMGGASTAAPLSALGALAWNPATISGLNRSELEVGLGFMSSDQEIVSRFGPFRGSTDSDSGVLPIPNFGWVQRLPDSDWTFGVGVNSVAGFKTNLPADPSNIVLRPQPLGLGRVSSEATFLQITAVLSYAVNNRLSIAAGPTIGLGQVGLEPFVFDSPNSDQVYPSGRATQYHWGGGAQAGLFYQADNGINYGASIRSPTWFETFEFEGQDENGFPREMTASIDLPMIVSIGTALTAYESWLFALDVRYLDYENADGFGDPATFRPDGSLRGLDWSSVVTVAVGAQRQIGHSVLIRGGYTYNQSPIKDREAFFNIPTPLFYEHMLSVGGSYEFCPGVSANVAYSHYFENEVRGPIYSPGLGAAPGTSLSNRISADIVSFGVLFRH